MFLASGLLAAPPRYHLGLQGRLSTPAGPPVTGPQSVLFSLYTTDDGGSAVWTESDVVALDQNGTFSTTLGDATSLETIDFKDQYWVGVSLDGGTTELTPRLELNASPYAVRPERHKSQSVFLTTTGPDVEISLAPGEGTYLAGGTITVPEDGVYMTSGHCGSYSPASFTAVRDVVFSIQGTQWPTPGITPAYFRHGHDGHFGYSGGSVSAILRLYDGEIIGIYGRNLIGSTTSISWNQCRFSIVKLSE